MKDDDFWSEEEKRYISKDEEETKRRFPSFFLIFLFTSVGIMLALGVSLSAMSLLNGNIHYQSFMECFYVTFQILI